ncbi:MAG: MBL fold metallo-hydrolase, partial [Anaerolineae bacterium]|nr:MBL fold metallo-hydrolase [Anaerolineae bacterium]
MRPNERTRATYLVENYEPLMRRGQLRLLEDDEEELVPGVFAVRTPGHTPGHLAVRLQAGDEHAAFICDLASYAVHFERLGWMTAYDVEPLVTLETKRVWQQWALQTGALLIFPHDHQIPAGRLTHPAEGHPVIAPVPAAYS